MNWREGSRRDRSSRKQPAHKPGSARRGWRSGKSAAGASAEPAHSWSERQGDPAAGRRTAFAFRLFLVLLAAVGLTVLFIVLVKRTPEKTQLVIVAPRDGSRGSWRSTRPLQAEAAARWRDAAAFNRNLALIDQGSDPFFDPDASWDEVARSLKLRAAGPGKNLLVFHISAPTAVKQTESSLRGYLLPTSEAPLDSDARWIDVERLLLKIAELPTSGGAGQKLVLLDAHADQPLLAPGLLFDRFPDAVAEAYDRLCREKNIANLHVIVSHQAGERNWPLPEVGMSSFAYLAMRALVGEADGAVAKDNVVSFLELVRFLRAGLYRYVSENRESPQSPLVLSPLVPRDRPWDWAPGAAPLDVVFLDAAGGAGWTARLGGDAPRGAELAKRIRDRAGPLQAAWREYAQLDASGRLDRAPAVAAQAAAVLIRMEQLKWEPDAAEFNRLRELLDGLFKELRPAQTPGGELSWTAMRAAGRDGLDSARIGFLSELWARWTGLRDPLERAASDEEKQKAEADLAIFRQEADALSANELLQLLWQGFTAPGYSITASDLQLWLPLAETRFNQPLPLNEAHYLLWMLRDVDWQAGQPLAADDVRAALVCRGLSEALTARVRQHPAVLPWIAEPLEKAESERRIGEDLLLASAFAEAQPRLEEARRQLESVQQTMEQIVAAYAWRDRAARELPAMVVWQLRRERAVAHRAALLPAERRDDPPAGNAGGLSDRLLQAAVDLGSLDAVLSRASPAADAWGEKPRQTSDQLGAGLQAVRSEFNRHCQQLSEGESATVATWVDIDHALQCPLVDVEIRQRLHERCAAILESLAGRSAPQTPTAGAPEVIAGESFDQFRQRVAAYENAARGSAAGEAFAPLLLASFASTRGALVPSDPLQALLGPLASAPADDLQRQCEIRRPVDGPLRRLAGAVAERQAALDGTLVAAVRGVARDLHEGQTTLALLWIARRALDDCWGDSIPIRPGDPLPSALFERQFDFWLEQLPREHRRCQQAEELAEVRQQRSAALADLQIETPELVYDPAAPASGHRWTARGLAALPPGIAALFDRSLGPAAPLIEVELQGNQRHRRVQLPTAAADAVDQDYYLPLQPRMAERRTIELEALFAFRGHLRSFPFRARPQTAIVDSTPDVIALAHQPRPLGSPTVLVRQAGTNVTDVMFVVDCSQSMSERIASEIEGGTDPNPTDERLNVLRSAVQPILGEMENRRSYRIGLTAFGHRVAPHEGGRLEYIDPARGEKEWASLQLWTDADVLHSPPVSGVSSSGNYQLVRRLLTGLKPYGQTPLYYGILTAARDLQRVGRSSDLPRLMIVLTDGVNETSDFPPNLLRTRTTDNPDLEDGQYYAQLVRDGQPTPLLTGIRIFIVGFNVNNDQSESTQRQKRNLKEQFAVRLKQLETIATATEGAYFYVDDLKELRSLLKEIIEFEQFRVVAAGGEPTGEPLDLGASWRPPDDQFLPGPYDVVLTRSGERQATFLRGGERVVLEFGENRTLRYELPELDPMERRRIEWGEGPARGTYEIGQLRPNTHRRETPFRFSFINQDPRQFSYRPNRLALEVFPREPLVAPPVWIQDFDFETDKTAPVAEFSGVLLQPGDYGLRLWTRPFAAGAASVERAIEWSGGPPAAAQFGEHDVTIAREGDSIQVTLSGGEAESLRTVLVELCQYVDGQWRPASADVVQRVVRRYQVDGKQTEHHFEVGPKLAAGRWAIGLTSREKAFAGGQSLDFEFRLEQ